ncbi:MAG: hypothetical protein ABWU13_21400, partial [Limnospira maxima]
EFIETRIDEGNAEQQFQGILRSAQEHRAGIEIAKYAIASRLSVEDLGIFPNVGTYKQLWDGQGGESLIFHQGVEVPLGGYFGHCIPISLLNVSHA